MTAIERPGIAFVEPPSMRKIIIATGLALIAAVVILILFVLPAEYGIDPLGTGKALGLTDLVRVADKPAPTSGEASIVPVLVPSTTGAPTIRGTFLAQPNRFQLDSRELTLARGEGAEIKYHMIKGAGLVYSWTASANLSFEFHGEPNVKPAGEGTDYFESYELDDKGKDHDNGTFVAPSTGIHGWFWKNGTSDPVTLKVATAGFYDWVLQNIKDKQTALKPLELSSLPSHPTIPDQVFH
jgi:hypothetical protein